jgi:putative ABC transport system ATP-binding protein
MTKSSPIISLTNIVKKYNIGSVETIVLKKVSFNVNKGEMIAIVGASGSGKSTMMNIIGLLDKADSGTYLIKGNDVAGLEDDELAKLRNQSIGFVFQQFNLLPRFNAMKNIELPLIYRAISKELINQKVSNVLKRVGMEDFASHRPTQLSGGQQQRIAIARALVGDPEVILADEPTGSLDSRTGKEIMDLFLDLHREGRTIILVTHDERVASLCERRITLVDGKIVSSQ